MTEQTLVLVDTSAWVEFLRGTGSSYDQAVRELLQRGGTATTDAILLEVLAGTTDERRARDLGRLLQQARYLPQVTPGDAETAASLYRECRRAGETPRALSDCLVAAVALRHGIPLLHRDRDFDILARHVGLEVTPG